MAQEFQYFYEDEVYRFSKKGPIEFGMVLENAEFVSSDDDSDDEEDKVTKGSIRVAWYPRGEEQVLQERKVGLADRSLMPGDVVRRLIRGKDTQRGYCRQVSVSASVQVVGSKYVILNVDSGDLTPLEEFITDIAVSLDSWVGMVHTVKCCVMLLTPDGSKCILSDQEALMLDEIGNPGDPKDLHSEFRRCDFYPGQKLVGLTTAFEEAEWIEKTSALENMLSKPTKYIKATVCEVKVVQLGVRWQCRAFTSDPNPDREQPKYLVQGEDLKRVRMLNIFEPCTLQLGDRNLYLLKENNIVLRRDQWRKLVASQLASSVSNPCPLRPRTSKRKKDHKTPKGDQPEAAVTPNNSYPECIAKNDYEDSKLEVLLPNCQLPTSQSPCLSSDEYADVETDDESDAASVSSGASSSSQGRQKKKGPALSTKVLNRRKMKWVPKHRKELKDDPPKPGDKLVVETLMTTSKADVVWQDGSVESHIPSTVLYPIHHLDDHEFFPGDFVIEQKDCIDSHEYGVVQRVDHAGRTALVKWFKTYTAGNDPQPQFIYEQEVSVYDLRDHPDFRYRPGSVVIRVANFENGQIATAGQVLDNFPSGEVSVWWVDGRKSVCFPQDLYKVGEYDSDEGELWEDTSSDGSWETESEHSFIAEEGEQTESESALKTRLVANIEKARIGMSRLEEIFTQNPSLQTTAVMKQLLDCYKECRYMDKLMNTKFFHETNFQGLIEKVRERGRASTNQRMTEQFNRLFSTPGSNGDVSVADSSLSSPGANKVQPLINGICNFSLEDIDDVGSADKENGILNVQENVLVRNVSNVSKSIALSSSDVIDSFSETFSNLIAATPKIKSLDMHRNRGGSEYFRSKNCSETDVLANSPGKESTVGGHSALQSKRIRDSKSCGDIKSISYRLHSSSSLDMSEDVKTSHMCAQLCSLMKQQLLKTYEEVVSRYGGHFDMSLMADAELFPDDDDGQAVTVEVNANSSTPDNLGILNNGSNILSESLDTDNSNLVNDSIVLSPVAAASLAIPESVAIKPDGFQVLDSAPDCHKFKLTMFQPTDPSSFYRIVCKEMKLLQTSLPPGIWVRGYEDRMDLYSVMIQGPERTPYEDGLFFFDFQLPADYPRAPPLCHYVTYCSDKLNPNLYEDGNVCISLLGTWRGKGTEVWNTQSNLLQVIVSIQGLILVNEPYFNEAGYERQKGTQQGRENSRMYNEMVVLKLIQAMTKVLLSPPYVFEEELIGHFKKKSAGLIARLEHWLELSESYNASHPLSPATPNAFRELHLEDKANLPEFPLIPASKGFCITLQKTLVSFRDVVVSVCMSQRPPTKEQVKTGDVL